jgi:hypothetical protein
MMVSTASTLWLAQKLDIGFPVNNVFKGGNRIQLKTWDATVEARAVSDR